MARSSIKEVAALAGVSTATVSRCINTAEKVSARTRAKVASAIKTLDYTPNTLAQQFRRGRTQMVMVVVPAIGDPFFTEVMAGIRQVASARAYSVVINEAQVGSMPPNELSALRVCGAPTASSYWLAYRRSEPTFVRRKVNSCYRSWWAAKPSHRL